jgi:hypothetical protein
MVTLFAEPTAADVLVWQDVWNIDECVSTGSV